MARAEHWDEAYSTCGIDGVSWYQPIPALSLELVEALGVLRETAAIDVGSGGSFLADELVVRGFTDVTVLDVSAAALDATCGRLPADAPVRCIRADVLEWEPDRRYGLWHDRAGFHFLVDERDRDVYVHTLSRALTPGGAVILGAFADDGPEMCSGLPVRRHSAADLAEALGEGFTLLETRREVHYTPRGTPQPFAWVAGSLG